jgi:glycosyltransferase involved in cell wall biosynthesis
VRLLIDLQPLFAPTTRTRGIGLYAERLTAALLQDDRGHEVHLLLPHTGDAARLVEVRQRFAQVPPDRVHLVHTLNGTDVAFKEVALARELNEALREGLVRALAPDAVLVTSLFELGLEHPVTVARHAARVPTAVVLYDLLPLEDPSSLPPSEELRWAYRRKLEDLTRADVLLAISDHSASSATGLLRPAPPVETIYGAPVLDAAPGELPPGVSGAYVLCVGGDHPRKNLPGLLRGWAALESSLRAGRKLVVSCGLRPESLASLRSLAARLGIASDELVLTGYLPDRELAALYAGAELLVFPSFAEGLGLPALEAMRFGCPVVVADNTSLRELVTLPEARFDAADAADMARAIKRALIDPHVTQLLRDEAKAQGDRFTWARTAEATWGALERLPELREAVTSVARPRLAVVAPWPPVRSGVADYALATTLALREHYDVTLVGDAPGDAGLPVLARSQFLAQWHRFDRVLYHFGNSPHHVEDFRMLPLAPGVVMVHDTGLGATLPWVDEALGHPGGVQALLGEAGPPPAPGQADARGLSAVCAGALGLQVQSQHARAELARAGVAHLPVEVVPLPVAEALPSRRAAERDVFTIGHFGFVHDFKRPEVLIAAAALAQAELPAPLRVVFAGQVRDETYQARLVSLARERQVSVEFLGYVSADELTGWQASVDCAVQLRSVSHGESSGSVASLLAAGVPVVVSDIGSFAELPRDVVLHHAPDGSPEELAPLLVKALQDAGRDMGDRAASYARDALSLGGWARRTRDHLEQVYAQHSAVASAPALRAPLASASAELKELVGQRLAATCERPVRRPRFVASDISVLAGTPYLTGIQRMVLAAHRELRPLLAKRGEALVGTRLHDPPDAAPVAHAAIRADPVTNGVRVRAHDAEWLLCLDLDFGLAEAEAELVEAKARGTRVLVYVHDILPVASPQWFVPGTADRLFEPWLRAVRRRADVVAVNSRATAAALREWLDRQPPSDRDVPIHVVPLAVDVPAPPSVSMRPDRTAPLFAMVGTIEPRKGHDDVLDAFERLWTSGEAAALTFVGRQGWMVESLVERIRRHPELGRRLSWVEDADDAQLEHVLEQCDAALVASRGEGFGLPLLEANARGLPVIARDIPVLRELARDGVEYFAGDGAALAEHLSDWCRRWRAGTLPAVSPATRTWADVAQELLDLLDP